VYIFAEQIEQAFPVKAIVKPSVLSTRTFWWRVLCTERRKRATEHLRALLNFWKIFFL
jgi:hypothetical protein